MVKMMHDIKKICWIIILIISISIPLVAAEKTDTISILSPEEGYIFFHDVSPTTLPVRGSISGVNGIRNVTAIYGNERQECGQELNTKTPHFSCDFLLNDQNQNITVIVTGINGEVFSESRNFRSYGGLPPPGFIVVSGNVTDITGKPISDAIISFENLEEKKYPPVNITTDVAGKYSIKGDYGRHQKIIVMKEGYKTIYQEIVFKPYGNDLDFILLSQESHKSSSGVLSLTFAIIIFCIVVFFVIKKKYFTSFWGFFK